VKWKLCVSFGLAPHEDFIGCIIQNVEVPANENLWCFAFFNGTAINLVSALLNSGSDFNLEELAQNLLLFPQATDLGDGDGSAFNYALGCADGNPNAEYLGGDCYTTVGQGFCGNLPGYYYSYTQEKCLPLVPAIPIPGWPPPSPGPSPCPDGSQPPCVGHLDPPLPLASDGVGFSKPSNVALPVHPTVSAERIFEVCGACGDVDASEEAL
jgi:hypothetical protein